MLDGKEGWHMATDRIWRAGSENVLTLTQNETLPWNQNISLDRTKK